MHVNVYHLYILVLQRQVLSIYFVIFEVDVFATTNISITWIFLVLG